MLEKLAPSGNRRGLYFNQRKGALTVTDNDWTQILFRRFKLILLFLFGMVMAGIGAHGFGTLTTHLGLDEKTTQLAMTVAFFVVLIGGAWAYDRFR